MKLIIKKWQTTISNESKIRTSCSVLFSFMYLLFFVACIGLLQNKTVYTVNCLILKNLNFKCECMHTLTSTIQVSGFKQDSKFIHCYHLLHGTFITGTYVSFWVHWIMIYYFFVLSEKIEHKHAFEHNIKR